MVVMNEQSVEERSGWRQTNRVAINKQAKWGQMNRVQKRIQVRENKLRVWSADCGGEGGKPFSWDK